MEEKSEASFGGWWKVATWYTMQTCVCLRVFAGLKTSVLLVYLARVAHGSIMRTCAVVASPSCTQTIRSRSRPPISLTDFPRVCVSGLRFSFSFAKTGKLRPVPRISPRCECSLATTKKKRRFSAKKQIKPVFFNVAVTRHSRVAMFVIILPCSALEKQKVAQLRYRTATSGT